MTRTSDAEDELAFAILAVGLPEPERQYRYVEGRRFVADFAWPGHDLLLEVQGGIYDGRAHGSVSGILRDIERLNLATLAGWRLIRVTPQMVEDGEALELVEKALGVGIKEANRD